MGQFRRYHEFLYFAVRQAILEVAEDLLTDRHKAPGSGLLGRGHFGYCLHPFVLEIDVDAVRFEVLPILLQDGPFREFCDVEKVITLEQVESTINLLMAYSDRLKKSKWAIVTSKPASYGMMRLLSVHAEKIPLLVRVFKDHKTAGRWLASGMSKKSA